MKKKKFLSLFIICAFMFSILGCSGSRSDSSSGKKVKVLASFASVDTFKQTIVDGMNSYAEKNNMDVVIKSVNNDVERQVQDIKSAKSNGFNAVACVLADADTAQQIINAAGDLPVIFLNVEPDAAKLKEDKYIYVASDENEVVDMTAKSLESKFSANKSFNAVLFEGDKNSKSTTIRTDSLKYRLKKDGYNVNYVFEDSAVWDRDKAKDMFKTFLKLKQNYDCVIANNDDMALGVIDAMKEEGIDPSSVPIYGVDATAKACEAIINGDMAFTIKQSGEGQATSIMKAAQALVDGKSIKKLEHSDGSGKYIWFPYTAVDKNNASQFNK